MTVKQWNQYPEFDKELMLEKVEVILTDHETRHEKLTRYRKSINWNNYKKFWQKFDKGMKIFDDSLKEFDREFGKHLGSTNNTVRKSTKTKSRKTKNIPLKTPKSQTDLIFGSKKTKVKVF